MSRKNANSTKGCSILPSEGDAARNSVRDLSNQVSGKDIKKEKDIDIRSKKYYNVCMYLCPIGRYAGSFLQKEAKCDGLCRAIYG